MSRQVSASDAKNNFGGFLESVAAFGRVDITRHGRLVAVVLSPRELDALVRIAVSPKAGSQQSNHMIPAHLARQARMLREPAGFDED